MLYEMVYTVSRTMISGEKFWPIFKFARVKSQLGPVCDELDKRKINLEKLLVSGIGSMADLFHPDSRYTSVDFYGFLSKSDCGPTTGAIYVKGVRPRFLTKDFNFDVSIVHLPLGFKVPEDHFEKIKRVEAYFLERMAAQNPKLEYNFTYRTITEVKEKSNV